MKTLLLLFIACFILSNAYTQKAAGGGFRRAGTNAQVKGMHKKQFQDSLGITAAQADKVDAIQQDFKLKMRAVNLDTQISGTEKKSKLAALKQERNAKLSEVLTAQQIAKMDGVKPEIKKAMHKKKRSAKKG